MDRKCFIIMKIFFELIYKDIAMVLETGQHNYHKQMFQRQLEFCLLKEKKSLSYPTLLRLIITEDTLTQLRDTVDKEK